ncbi:hypothetical protein F5Y19DRAFT_470647 [Xylariaceae sp. FL1651]|nr:hypothetical protein F5Y19DRAFT_470647 [Xylariaceae sp. FL1651]
MNSAQSDKRGKPNGQKKPPRIKRNPIETAITSWYERYAALLTNRYEASDLIAQAPKRWTVYGVLVLLPAGSFTSQTWRNVLDLVAKSPPSRMIGDNQKRNDSNENTGATTSLWMMILDEISRLSIAKLTHLAANEGIPLHSNIRSDGTEGSENILRSPSSLRMLHGDFGPSALSTSTSESNTVHPEANGGAIQTGKVTEDDFTRAFWVSTKQNGITQTWAPRWTMFSRGNIKEKARLLNFHNVCGMEINSGHLLHREIPVKQRRDAIAVDLYAGIGYFAFCYAALGFRVLCWELNPWSVEGLRRGAKANGWSVRVISSVDERNSEEEERMMREVLGSNETIVVFQEDNTRAASRIKQLAELTRECDAQSEREQDKDQDHVGLQISNILHVNCGLLPTSEGSWNTAWDIARESKQTWLHIHENVGALDIDAKKEEIQQWFVHRARSRDEEAGTETDVCVEHVEQVKTFAPGVWHCVFDLSSKDVEIFVKLKAMDDPKSKMVDDMKATIHGTYD